MAEISLTDTTGRVAGTRSSRRLRAEGKVPAVVYGLGREPVAVTVDWRELRTCLITDAGVNALIDLSIEGEGESQLAIVKDMQRHPIRQTVDHVDFLLIRRDQEITVDIPLVAEGAATDLEKEGGVIETLLTTLAVNAKPGSIPDQLTYDISSMAIGDTITVGEVALPGGVTVDLDPDETIARALVARAAGGHVGDQSARGRPGAQNEATLPASAKHEETGDAPEGGPPGPLRLSLDPSGPKIYAGRVNSEERLSTVASDVAPPDGERPGSAIEAAVEGFRSVLQADAELFDLKDPEEAAAEGRGAAAQVVASARWAAVVGDRLSTTEVASLLGVSRQALSKRQRTGSLLGLPGRSTTWYPAWQFDVETRAARPEVRYIIGAFRDRLEHDFNPMAVAAWATTEQVHDLDGLTPARWLVEGRAPERLLAAADRAAARLAQ